MNQRLILGLTFALVILVFLSSSMFAEEPVGGEGPEGGVVATVEYRNVTKGETFSVYAPALSSYKWILKNYDGEYLDRTGLLSSIACSGSPEVEATCNYVFTFKAIKEGQTTIEINKINISDNNTVEIKYVYVTIVTLTSPICTDSDGGKNYYTYGVVRTKTETSSGTYYDLCWSGTDVLHEWYCDGWTVKKVEYECPNGCASGACKPSPLTCTDSDGGKNYYTYGVVTQGTASSPDCCAVDQYSPNCVSSSNYLAERFCNLEGNLDTYIAYCQYGCKDGTCLKSEACIIPTTDDIAYVNKSAIFHVTNANKILISTSTFNDPYLRCYAAWAKKADGTYVNLNGDSCSPEEWRSNPYCSCPTISRNGDITYDLSKFGLAPFTGTIEFRVSAYTQYCYYWTAKLSYASDTIKIAHLNVPFELKTGERAEVVDYKNMMVILDKLDTVEICPVTTTTNVETNVTQQQVCMVKWLATVSMRIPGDLAIATKLGPGETRDTPFGVKIRFDRLVDPNTAVFTVFQETKEFRFAIKTDKYWYSSGETARIDAILTGDSSINLADANVITYVVDPNGKEYEIQMRKVGIIAPTCTESLTTGTYTCARVNEYHFMGTFNIPYYASSGLYIVRATATAANIKKNAETGFKVGETYSKGVDLSISPEIQVTSIGKEASYKVTITDKHPISRCPVVAEAETIPAIGGVITAEEAEVVRCGTVIYNYIVDVYGLPYHTVFPNVVSVPAGGSETFELKVFPSPVKTAEGITTAVKTAVIETVSTEERTVSITGQQIATQPLETMGEFEVQPAAVNDALFKFTVKATLREDPTVSDSTIGILHVRFVQIPEPPAFPEEETIKIILRRGWNLVSLPGKGTGFIQGTCSAAQKPFAYVYLQDQRRYITIEEAVRILGPEKLLEYLSTHSFWIYSYEDCSIGFKVQSYSTYSGLSIVEGWNLLGTTKDMVGGTLNNIKGTCNFEKIYTWNQDSQKWIEKTENDLIEKMGYGILVKANSACRLEINTIQPPEFAEGD